MRAGNENERVRLRLINEHGAEMPLRDDEGHTDGQDLDLSDGLRADLRAFAARWDAAVPDATFDDRFSHVPRRRTLVDAARSLRHLTGPGARQDAAVNDERLPEQTGLPDRTAQINR